MNAERSVNELTGNKHPQTLPPRVASSTTTKHKFCSQLASIDDGCFNCTWTTGREGFQMSPSLATAVVSTIPQEAQKAETIIKMEMWI